MRVCLFEDRQVADLAPLCLTRPAFALLCGCTTLADKQTRAFSPREVGALIRPYLADVVSSSWPGWQINDMAWLRCGTVVLVNARWLPSGCVEVPSTPCVGLVDGQVAYAVLTPAELLECSPFTLDHYLQRWQNSLPAHAADGRMLNYLWDLVEVNGKAITQDHWWQGFDRPRRLDVLPTAGPADALHVDPTAHLDPLVALDTTTGPIVIDRAARIESFSHLQGPCYVGPGARVQGAKVRPGSSIGRHCRVGGEVEASIFQGYSNKAHDGFIGHSFVGEWVNLGAGTSNSDLRNDYGPVRVMVNGQLVRTNQSKVGCFLGDHTKAGLGTLLNTGASVGIFSNLLPAGGLLPRDIASFATVRDGEVTANEDLESLLNTADRVMRRRERALDEAHERLYRWLWAQAEQRRRGQESPQAEAYPLRRSA